MSGECNRLVTPAWQNSYSEQHFQNGFGRQIDLLSMMMQIRDSHDGKKAKREPRKVPQMLAVSVPAVSGEGQW